MNYRSLGGEQLEDVELLCRECHTGADETRAAESRPKHDEEPQEGLIVGIDDDQWGKLDPDMLQNGRYVPVPGLRWKGKS